MGSSENYFSLAALAGASRAVYGGVPVRHAPKTHRYTVTASHSRHEPRPLAETWHRHKVTVTN
jgi:hypothetical protein